MSFLEMLTSSGRKARRERLTAPLIEEFAKTSNYDYSARQQIAYQLTRLRTDKGCQLLIAHAQSEIRNDANINSIALVVRAFGAHPTAEAESVLRDVYAYCVEKLDHSQVNPGMQRMIRQTAGSSSRDIAVGMLTSSMTNDEESSRAYDALARMGSYKQLAGEAKRAIQKCGGVPPTSRWDSE